MSDPDLKLQASLGAWDWQLAILRTRALGFLALTLLPILCTPPLLFVAIAIDYELLFLMFLLLAGIYTGCWLGIILQLARPFRDTRRFTRLPVEARISRDGAWFLMGDRGRGVAGVDVRTVIQLGSLLIVRTHDDDLLVLKGEPTAIRQAANRLHSMRERGTTQGARGERPAGLSASGRSHVSLADWTAFNDRYGPSNDRRIALWGLAVFLGLVTIAGLGGSIALLTVDLWLALSCLFLCGLLAAGTVQLVRLARGFSPFLRRLRARPELYEDEQELAWGEDGLWVSGRVDRWLAWSAVEAIGRSKAHAFLPTDHHRGLVLRREALEPDSDTILKAWQRWHNHAQKNPPRPPKREDVPPVAQVDPFQAPRD